MAPIRRHLKVLKSSCLSAQTAERTQSHLESHSFGACCTFPHTYKVILRRCDVPAIEYMHQDNFITVSACEMLNYSACILHIARARSHIYYVAVNTQRSDA